MKDFDILELLIKIISSGLYTNDEVIQIIKDYLKETKSGKHK